MCLRANRRAKDGKDHIYWSLVETVRTADGRMIYVRLWWRIGGNWFFSDSTYTAA